MKQVMQHTNTRLISLFLFGIAMGFLEATVVVYLRELYYPEGFSFPVKVMALEVLSIEYFREASTIVMLLTIAFSVGKNFYERFAFLLFCFGVWDIFYYTWLKVLMDWPPSLLTWDILFLIPVVWTAPVIAPLMCAITLVVIALCILYKLKLQQTLSIPFLDWFLLCSGGIVILLTFIWEYALLIVKGGFLPHIQTLYADPAFHLILSSYVPQSFSWIPFAAGMILVILFVIRLCLR